MTMTHRIRGPFLLCALALSVGSLGLRAQTAPIEDACVKTAGMQVYSNVFIHEETGDLLGYDLAIKRQGSSGAEALLYVYEGGDAGEGIPLSGQVSKNRLTLRGTWVEQLLEYPSKRKILEQHSVEILGIVTLGNFSGELTISKREDHQRVRFKRVNKIWSCHDRNANPG
jgi:hypothetical protein